MSWAALGMPCVSSVSLWAPLACFPVKVVILMSSVRDIVAFEELGRGQAPGRRLPCGRGPLHVDSAETWLGLTLGCREKRSFLTWKLPSRRQPCAKATAVRAAGRGGLGAGGLWGTVRGGPQHPLVIDAVPAKWSCPRACQECLSCPPALRPPVVFPGSGTLPRSFSERSRA